MTASLVPGMSGGPVIDRSNAVIGVIHGAATTGSLSLFTPVLFARTLLFDAGIDCRNEYAPAPKQVKASLEIQVIQKPNGSRRFRLSELKSQAERLPTTDECEEVGRALERHEDVEKDALRFWVRLPQNEIGYCLKGGRGWLSEHYDRDWQDALLVTVR